MSISSSSPPIAPRTTKWYRKAVSRIETGGGSHALRFFLVALRRDRFGAGALYAILLAFHSVGIPQKRWEGTPQRGGGGDGQKKCKNYNLVSMGVFLQKECDGGVDAMNLHCNFIRLPIGREQSITPSLAEETRNI